MALKAIQTERKDGRNAVIRFEIPDADGSPAKEFNTGDYASGQKILKEFRAWAKQFGDVELGQ